MSNCFHLAVEAGDLDTTSKWYTDVLGCDLDMSEEGKWQDINFFGNELTLHSSTPRTGKGPDRSRHHVDMGAVCVPHFGIHLNDEDFARVRASVEANGGFLDDPYIRFAGTDYQQETFFVEDPNYNVLEIKQMAKGHLGKPHKFKNILAGGCSFSQDGIGGYPPTSTSLGGGSRRLVGGNSFRTDVDYQASVPRSWTSMLAQQFDPDSFTNVAVSANGLVATCTTICDMLDKFAYSPKNTLVIFNVTRLGRLDVKVDFNNDNDYEPWTEDILDYSFLKCNKQRWKEHLANTTIEQIEKESVKHLEKLFEYLYNNQYPFVFTLLDDISDLPIIQKYIEHLVPLPHIGMLEFCRSIDEEDGTCHPTLAGHIEVAKLANRFIQEKYINTQVLQDV